MRFELTATYVSGPLAVTSSRRWPLASVLLPTLEHSNALMTDMDSNVHIQSKTFGITGEKMLYLLKSLYW